MTSLPRLLTRAEMVGEVLEVMRKLAGEGLTMIIVTHENGLTSDVSSHGGIHGK
ncbi:MAG: hypothetical protein ACLR0U_30180 [Enterocloster clostridioformis]